jgi:RND family efflux transporter MFP subunit
MTHKPINLIAVISIVTGTLLSSCNGKKATEMQSGAIPVKVIEITASPYSGQKNYVGTVEELSAIPLSFPVMGTVEQVLVKEGQRVQKGQLLALLNTATAESAYQAATAKLRQAQDAYDRLIKVYQNGSLPEIKFVEVESGLQQAKSTAAITQKNLNDCKLYASGDGIISKRNIEPGANAMPGIPAFELVSVKTLMIKISVSENEITSIAERQPASITVPALNNASYSGHVAIKGVVTNTISHTYEAKIEIDNSDSQLMPGMICNVILADAKQTTEIIVPNRSIQISPDNKHYVWLAEDGVAKRRFVEIGNLASDGIIVTQGLSIGDKLLTEGFLKISEGTKIEVTK